MKIYPLVYQRCLLMLGFKLTVLFDRYNVEYITCGGTLLGQIRHKGLLLHDYDIDYEVVYSSNKKFFELVQFVDDHPEYGLKSSWHLPHMVKFVPLTTPEIFKKINFNRPGVPSPTVDVFLTEPRPGGGMQLVQSMWPNWYYLPGEVYPIVKREFSGQLWASPNNATAILRRYYGATYMVPKFYKWPKNHPIKEKCGPPSGTTSSPIQTKTRSTP